MDTLADAKPVPEGATHQTLEPGFWVFPKKYFLRVLNEAKDDYISGFGQEFCRVIPKDKYSCVPVGSDTAYEREDGCLVIVGVRLVEECHMTTTEEAMLSGTVP